MKAKLLTGIGLVFAAAVVFIVRGRREVSHGRATLAELVAQRVALVEQATRLEERLRTAQGALAESKRSPEFIGAEIAGNASARDLAAAKPPEQPETSRRGNPLTVIANNPRMRAEHLKNIRATVVLNYGPALKAAGLSPEQLERFKDVEVELEEAEMDLQAAVDNHELDPDSPAYKKLVDEKNAARVTKKAAVLGEQMGRYLDYYRSNNVREYARWLAQTALVTGEMITAAQIDGAGDILAANCKRSGPDAYPGWTDANSLNWPAASEQLKAILSPAQIEFIRLQDESRKVNTKVEARTRLLTAQFRKQANGR